MNEADRINMIRMASQSMEMPERREALYPVILWGMYLAGVATGLFIACIIIN